MKVVVLADSHTMISGRERPSRPLPMGTRPYIETADHILHAGDVCDVQVLEDLNRFAPVTAVMGNCDPPDIRSWGATDETTLELGGASIGMTHDAGLRAGRAERLRSRWPSADVVVFGHSHMPVNEEDDDVLLFNPGSPTWKRRAPFESMGILWIEDGLVEGEIFPV